MQPNIIRQGKWTFHELIQQKQHLLAEKKSSCWKIQHVFIVFSEIVSTIVGLLDSWMPYTFLFLWHLPSVASIGQVNLIYKKPKYRDTFIINWLVDNVNWNEFSLFLTSKFMFYYLVPIKFFQHSTRKVSCNFIFTLNFLFDQKPELICSLEQF